MPLDVWGQDLIVLPIDIIGSRENGDNNGETGEDRGGVESPHSNYGWFGLYFFSKMDEVHIISDMYMHKASIPTLIIMSQNKMGIKAQIMGANQCI